MALNHGYIESAFSFEPMQYPPLMEYKWNIGHPNFYHSRTIALWLMSKATRRDL
jgi:hypothetical protein